MLQERKNMFNFLKEAIDPLANIAMEMIETDKESAEARAVMVKVLDPNGKMRAQISRDIVHMYKVYLYVSLALIIAQFFGIGDGKVELATTQLTELFLPITGMVSLIVSASYGVNAMNSYKGKGDE